MARTDTKTSGPAAADTLADQLLNAQTFPRFAGDAEAFVQAEIAKHGMALRAAFKVVKKLKPNIIERVVREIAPDFVHALEPCYAEYRQSAQNDLRAHLLANETAVADAALSAADRRAERIESRTIRSAYDRVRGRAQREVVDSVPEIATIIARHAQ